MFSRLLYSFVFYLIVPIILLRLLIRGLKAEQYWQRWDERFGQIPKIWAQKRPIWVHAVSVGEFIAATPIVNRLLRDDSDAVIVITTMTPTGSERVKAVFGDKVHHFYMPYDLPHVMSRVITQLKPSVLVIMETEIWPNLVYHSHANNVPVLLANARMSERSAKGYQRFSSLTRQTLERITLVAAQNPADAERFIDIGALPERTRVMGNVKFDLKIPASLREQSLAFRHQWGVNRPVWIAASTHEGEDEQILQLHKRILEAIPDVLLVIVPRHPERFDKVANLAKKLGYVVGRRSGSLEHKEDINIFVGDTMGELMLFLSASDVAFIGGSLIPSGGHNVLEASALGLPVVFGPHMFNFSEVSRLILDAKAGLQVEGGEQLASTIINLLQSASDRAELGEQGIKVVEQNKGAIDILVKEIHKYSD
ncbi:MAG: 3-deoxy-D-manno-octulosonic acid transferase [Methylococcales bacterium]|jgi:3-deoxy-D-manno-octulosonic-acid transferase|nr:3-deoxy-D-manno-octulosonic acid transferase [Methylococcales bacterium]